jgi:uncharacterized protein (DUF433 family)
MDRVYIEEREAGLYIGGSKVSLDSIVYAFQRGSSPEEIQQDWPVLNLEQVYGAITYYLAHREAVDEYLRDAERRYASAVPPMSEATPDLYAKLRRARQELARER